MWGDRRSLLVQKHATGRDGARRRSILTILHCTNVQLSRSGPRSGPAATRSRARRASRCATASGSPSVWPTWLAGMVLCGTWIARMPGVVGAPDVVEEPVADVDAAGRVGGADRLHRRPERVRRRLRPRDLAGVDVAVDEVERRRRARRSLVPLARPDRVGQHADLDPVGPQRLEQRPDLGVGRRCAAPRTRSRPSSSSGSWSSPASSKRSAIVELCWWSRLRPQIASPAACSRWRVHVGGRGRAFDDRLGERERLGVEVDVVPAGEGAAPVEDDGVDAAPHARTSRTTWSTTWSAGDVLALAGRAGP